MTLILNYKGFENNLVKTRQDTMGGIQYLFRFENNYGASVIKSRGSYGHKRDLWELAVIIFYGEGDNDWNLNYGTYITNDVIGDLTDDSVQKLLKKISKLKKPKRKSPC